MDTSIYNIVVVGDMNPRIHSPAWYQLVGLISEEEMIASTKSPSTMALPPIAQVQLAGILIVCEENRWTIQTSDPALFERIIAIASKVFDALLQHTPVAALGFNFTYDRKTKTEDVGRYLASCISRIPVGLSDDALVSGELSLRRQVDGRTILVAIRPDTKQVASGNASILNNYEYKFESDTTEFFDLAKTIESRFLIDFADAEKRTKLVLEAIEQGGR